MDDISILIFLLSLILFFIILYIIIRFIFIEKRSFTFEIINIPLGIFKFDKRDEFMKKNNSKLENGVVDNSNLIENEKNYNLNKLNSDVNTDEVLEEKQEYSCNKKEVTMNKLSDEFDECVLEENNEQYITTQSESEIVKHDIVYWTANGKAYHTSNKCRTLSRSKAIFNGTKNESGKYIECIHCKV